MAITSFRHKGLGQLWIEGKSKHVRPDLVARVKRCLQLLHAATTLNDLRQAPALRLHQFQGQSTRWTISVNGPWRITFEWEAGNASGVDLEQYH